MKELIKNTNDGFVVWYTCPTCMRYLEVTEFCPRHSCLGEIRKIKDNLTI